MKLPLKFIGIFLSFVFVLSFQTQAIDNTNVSAEKFEYFGTLSFLDGTPVEFNYNDDLLFEIIHIKSKTSYTPIKKFVKDTVYIDFVFVGDYVMKFMDIEVARFNVVEVDGQLTTNLSHTLRLPFNYIISAEEDQTINVYDENIQFIESFQADKNGVVALKGDENYYSNKLFVVKNKNGFPRVNYFKPLKAKDKSKFNLHRLLFNKAVKPKAVPGLVHNINDDIFYTIRKISFTKDRLIWVLLKYNNGLKKGSIYKLDFTADLINSNPSLFLDETGRVVVVLAQHNTSNSYDYTNYIIDNDGKLQAGDDIYVNPIYCFDGNFVKGSTWYIPTFNGIPLAEGMHNFKVSCKDDNGDGITSSNQVEVVFSKEVDYVWQFLNPNGETSSYPEVINSETDFSKINIRQCNLSIDGGPASEYSYMDESVFKGIFYSDMSESEKAEARKGALKTARVYIGIDEEGDRIGRQINIFQGSKYSSVSGPINMFEGPYPELRYKAFEIIGEYPTREEALKYCKIPKRKRNTFQCLEEHIVSVCLNNYSYNITDQGLQTNFDALFCNETLERDESKGNEIVVEVTALGYIEETRALAKKDLEISSFTLSGRILDKTGLPIDSAKVSLRGLNDIAFTNKNGEYTLKSKARGTEPYSESMDIKLQKIGIEISNDELGKYEEGKNFGVVSDGFTTLKLKVKAKGIRPESVVIKPPRIGNFVEQSFLKIPLVLDENGLGEMEFVPPEYLKQEDLNYHLKLSDETANKDGLSTQTWVAVVPIVFSYEDDEGNPGTFTMNILVCRPPVFLIHGFTGDETTWATLANYLRVRKYETIVQEYYKGSVDESTIERQSQKLGQYIQDLRNDYKLNGILQTRIDIVAHSMGGLISRHYINNLSKYGKKAGMVIPYNVKLSIEQLAAARNQKPVKLIDVRKLIMVGTPNHGASKIDEIFGIAGALSSNSHQLANAQLRSDSEFFKVLNSGENEGRHLDRNVQYALLYGIRKRSEFYPPDRLLYPWQTSQKNFADDDGVVKVSSAKLNGVKDYSFPKDWFAMHGFIHSLAVEPFFMGDAAITESTSVFEKVEELLQEEIVRMPLANSFSKFIAFDGDAFMRYFSTKNWELISSLSTKKLNDQWCQIKTDEGSASLGFFLNGHHWGALHVMPNSIVYCENTSPEFVKVYLQKGKARFRSRKQGGGGFEVVMGDEGEKWYAFNPKAKVRDMDTDFIVEEGDTLKVHSINGKVAIGVAEENGKKVSAKNIVKNEGITLDSKGIISDNPLPESGWWSEIDTTFVDNLSLKDSSFIPIQKIGDLELFMRNNYLPISGISNLNIQVKDEKGENIERQFKVNVTLEEQEKLPFIEVINSKGLTDSIGNFISKINISKPSYENYHSLNEIPLKVTFNISILHPETNESLIEKSITVPLGMCLLFGQTIGPDYQPLQQTSPPEFYGTSYQIASSTDDIGNFFILFNTALFNEDVTKFKSLAKRTQLEFNMDQFDFSIQWSDSASTPLKYYLPDSINNKLKAGQKLKIGKNGLIDLLNTEEHVQRIKQMVANFVDGMPLRPEKKLLVLSSLNELSFNSDSSYLQMIHRMGHFLHNTICLPQHRYYNFLSQSCKRSETMWEKSVGLNKKWFDESEYISFNEAGANFFTFLLFKFLENTDKNFINKSVYAQQAYLNQFEDSINALNPESQFPAYTISGLQTKFLIDFYGANSAQNPVNVYADFLFNQMLFPVYLKGGDPASTINEWLFAKQHYYNELSFITTGDPDSLSNEYGMAKTTTMTLIPQSEYQNSSVEIDGFVVSDFSQIPVIELKLNSVVTILSGNFNIQIFDSKAIRKIEIESESSFKIGSKHSLELLSGNFHSIDSFAVQINGAKITPNSSNFNVEIEDGTTSMSVFEGEICVISSTDYEVIGKGQSATMNAKGKIKKPKEMEMFNGEDPLLEIETPFLIPQE